MCSVMQETTTACGFWGIRGYASRVQIIIPVNTGTCTRGQKISGEVYSIRALDPGIGPSFLNGFMDHIKPAA